MIEYRNGDIFKHIHEYDVFLHLANCQHIMGSGVAAGVRTNLPLLYAADLMTVKGPKKLGSFSQAYDARYHTVLINLYGQNHLSWDKPMLDPDALMRGLKAVNLSFPRSRICMPMIGTKRAGGNWDAIEKIISESLDNCFVTIFIYDK
jgi:O-acetyl-ADP-ribose deacetylase (regulator of RNase III)